MTGISRRAFGRTRGISEAAVRAHITSGVLAGAILPDGTIDPAKADKLLARSITKPRVGKVPIILKTAKLRRARAVARDLQDEVDDLERHLLRPGLAERVINEMFEETNAIIREWPRKIASAVVGQPADVVQRLLKTGVNDLLSELHEFLTLANNERPNRDPKPEPDLGSMTPVELAAHTENLRARVLELGRWERQRKLVRTYDVTDLHVEALTISKMLLMAVPGRTSILIGSARDLDEVIGILTREIDGVTAAAHIDLSPLTSKEPR